MCFSFISKHTTPHYLFPTSFETALYSAGDANSISVGAGTNIQDNTLVHVAKSNLSGKVLPTLIGDNVTVGNSAVLHGCTVEDEAYIGASATVLDGAHVEKHAVVESGALVRQNTRIPSGEVPIFTHTFLIIFDLLSFVFFCLIFSCFKYL